MKRFAMSILLALSAIALTVTTVLADGTGGGH